MAPDHPRGHRFFCWQPPGVPARAEDWLPAPAAARIMREGLTRRPVLGSASDHGHAPRLPSGCWLPFWPRVPGPPSWRTCIPTSGRRFAELGEALANFSVDGDGHVDGLTATPGGTFGPRSLPASRRYRTCAA